MQRVSGTVLRDIRNMRKHNTYNVPGSSDQRRDSYDGRVAAKFVINDEMREVLTILTLRRNSKSSPSMRSWRPTRTK